MIIVKNYTNNNKNEQSAVILTELTQHKKITTYDVGTQILAWDRHKKMAVLNLLIGSNLSPLDNWISWSIDISYIVA